MAEKKSKPKDKTAHPPVKTVSSHASPQTELIEKARHDPELGRKPPKNAAKKPSSPITEKPRNPSKNTESEALGSTTERVKKRHPKPKNLDTSGQDLNE